MDDAKPYCCMRCRARFMRFVDLLNHQRIECPKKESENG